MKFFSLIRNNIRTPYKLVFLNQKNLVEEYKLSLRIWHILLLGIIIVVAATILGYYSQQWLSPNHVATAGEVDKETVVELQSELNELDGRLNDNDEYISNLQKIFKGETPELDEGIVEVSDSVMHSEEGDNESDTSTQNTPHQESNVSINSQGQEIKTNAEFNVGNAYKFYFTPLRGIVTNEFNPLKNHPAIDISARQGEPIKSIADGVVLFADWTSSTGYVVMIQHPNNVISVYKHNSQVYKKVGDKVNMGEVISAVGNTGELTSGPHLHFEIWVNGLPENPKKFISF